MVGPNPISRQGLKPFILEFPNVAAGAATHKLFSPQKLIREIANLRPKTHLYLAQLARRPMTR